jgi:formylglycine-generating enzyme required for sulfatase activity
MELKMNSSVTCHHPVSKIRHELPEMKVVPAGSLMMGGLAEDKFTSSVEFPRHEVKFLEGFALGKYPVTRGDWRNVMGPPPISRTDQATDDCPLTNVNIAEVEAYLSELSRISGSAYRLPSEAEWEYACRAGSETIFPHGASLTPKDANFLYDESGSEVGAGHAVPVGNYPPNALGVFDMLGNVCEWTADRWHSDYQGAPADGSAWLTGGKKECRAIRGGAWDHLPRVLRSSWRDWASENARWDNLGFRIARSI